jgi:predicted ATP-dependent serine protease
MSPPFLAFFNKVVTVLALVETFTFFIKRTPCLGFDPNRICFLINVIENTEVADSQFVFGHVIRP